MDWFSRLTGFEETGYRDTAQRLEIRDGRLHVPATGRSFGVGTLELASLGALRARCPAPDSTSRLRMDVVQADARALHRRPEAAGAVFQVASQFNLLEMVGPGVTPEQGVTRYEDDPTQGPACAIAAGAATIFRNYFVPVRGGIGQTRDRQLDGLGDLGARLAKLTGRPVAELWEMRNGYALCTPTGLAAIGAALAGLGPAELDALRCLLRIGVHADVEVTDDPDLPGQRVTQTFCSALPVSYCRGVPAALWEPFARLVLDAAYEATFLAALENRARGGSGRLFLTRLGGGAFGNDAAWIDAAILRAVRLARPFPLRVSLVTRDPWQTEPLIARVRALGVPA